MVFRGFWDELTSPIIGLAPMDGVTDAPFRYMVAKKGKPSLIITEFTNVEGLARGAIKMLDQLRFDKIERPIVAQVYGVEKDSYYKVALIICYLGFDGIDINMGCPMHKIAERGSGAGLIDTPDLAKELIRTVQKATGDWKNGITLEEAEIRPKIITALKKMQSKEAPRRLLPVSVKTRIGTQTNTSEEWTKHLLEAKPANITMHGRTLKQLYRGNADWETIAKAAEIAKGSGTSFLGNGDISSYDDAKKKIEDYKIDGVLVGRATFGNPWFFANSPPSISDRIETAIEHSQKFEEIFSDRKFFPMRKHLAWYIKGFDGAKEVRTKLMKTESSEDVLQILNAKLSPST